MKFMIGHIFNQAQRQLALNIPGLGTFEAKDIAENPDFHYIELDRKQMKTLRKHIDMELRDAKQQAEL